MMSISRSSKATTLSVAAAFLLGGAFFSALAKASEGTGWSGQGIGGGSGRSPGRVSAAASLPVSPSYTDSTDLPARLTGVFVELAQKVTPAVVQIEVRRPGESSVEGFPGLPEPFREFFDLPGSGRSPSQQPPEEMAGGTGFIISPDGYILTNAHVVDQADRIMVNLVDRTGHRAELVGSDPTTDLAVIKIAATDLPTLEWGVSGEIRAGEPVMAVGNPGFSASEPLDYTVTTGIVSAVGRPLSIIRQSLSSDPDLAGYAIENFIQTDAVINPGNSGGPLVDLWGRVVGVNSAIASSDGHYQGYGFAIPADLAKKVSADLIEHGRVMRGWMGISVTEVTAEDAEVYGLPRVGGVLVQEVRKDGPARDAGLRVEDVILSLNGAPLQDSGDLQERVAELGPGARVEVEVYREGNRMTLNVRLGEAPVPAARTTQATAPDEGPEALVGIAVTDLTAEVARELGYSSPGGVVVTGVIPWSPAMRKGIAAGMRIREVGHTPIGSAREFRQVLSGLEGGDLITMLVETPDGNTRIINLRAETR